MKYYGLKRHMIGDDTLHLEEQYVLAENQKEATKIFNEKFGTNFIPYDLVSVSDGRGKMASYLKEENTEKMWFEKGEPTLKKKIADAKREWTGAKREVRELERAQKVAIGKTLEKVERDLKVWRIEEQRCREEYERLTA